MPDSRASAYSTQPPNQRTQEGVCYWWEVHQVGPWQGGGLGLALHPSEPGEPWPHQKRLQLDENSIKGNSPFSYLGNSY